MPTPVQGDRLAGYTIRASYPDATTATPTWDTIWDTTNGIYGADLPVGRLRVTNRLSQPSECEIEMPRIDYRGYPVKLGNIYDNDEGNIAPMQAIVSVYRFGVPIFSGPVVAYRGATEQDSILMQCKDFTYLFEKALIDPTYATSSTDIFSIVNALHAQWYNRGTGYGYAALQQVLDFKRYSTPGGSTTTTMGKSVAFRVQQYENVMLSDAMSQLSMIGGDGYQFQWWVEYVHAAINPPQPRVVIVSPYAYYRTWDNTQLYRLEAGEGTLRTADSCEWVVDGSQLANEYVVAGYGQGTSQQRAKYTGAGAPETNYRSPFQAFIESDQSVRRNDHAVTRAKAGWQRTRYPQTTLRMSWTAQEWGGHLPYDFLRPGARSVPIVRDSFLDLDRGQVYECSAWSIEVARGTEICSAEMFVPTY